MMVAVLNVIQNVIYYKFIKANVERTWWPIAVFIYLFSTSFYLLNFSMMRQGLVIAIFLWMWKYIKNRKWFIALLGLIAWGLPLPIRFFEILVACVQALVFTMLTTVYIATAVNENH